MKVVIDIEANGLENPDRIWLIVAKDIDTGEYHIFRNVTTNDAELNRFLQFDKSVVQYIGHNLLDYDYPVLSRLAGIERQVSGDTCLDTLIMSKLVNYSRKGGHSVENYGEEFGFEKGSFWKWTDESLNDSSSELFKELETYCIRDVDITHKIYLKYLKYINNPDHHKSIDIEHKFQYYVVNALHKNGFKFNVKKAEILLKNVEEQLSVLDQEISAAFPPRLKLIKEIHPKETKHGTLSQTDFRWVPTIDGIRDLSVFNGGPFCRCSWFNFNPSSHKQIIDVLHSAGWKPTDRTQTHIDCEREINSRKRQRRKISTADEVDLATLHAKMEAYSKYGWKVNEANLGTLPEEAPDAAKHLAKRILLESRRRTLTEWLGLIGEDGRIHGRFYGIGAWTHRMAHQQPNTANIPNEFDTDGNVKLLGKEMRQLWQAPKNRLLVGVDAEGIQLRIFAHYINDEEFTHALIAGKKSDKTDPHSLNQRILGGVCKSRAAAKRFIYALLLGAGLQKLSAILGCSDSETKEALDRLLERYTGWAELKSKEIPADAKRGYFIGLDGRKVAIPGDTAGERSHLCMSGYLQNGESIVMKYATLRWQDKLRQLEIDEKLRWLLVNFVHDEWQTEVNNNIELAIKVAQAQCDALREVGEELNLRCPLAGSYWNEDHNDYTIGVNWYTTH